MPAAPEHADDQPIIGLADLLVRAIAERREDLDEIARSSPDSPFELRVHYHPGMARIDMVIHATRRLPSVRAMPRQSSHRAERPPEDRPPPA